MKSKVEISQEMLGVDEQTGGEGFLWKSLGIKEQKVRLD
jgi:hypothetical protein